MNFTLAKEYLSYHCVNKSKKKMIPKINIDCRLLIRNQLKKVVNTFYVSARFKYKLL